MRDETPRRSSARAPRKSSGLLERYREGWRPPRSDERSPGRSSERSDGRSDGRDRDHSRSRSSRDDNRYPANQYPAQRNGHSSSRALRDDGRYQPRERSRPASDRDDDVAPRRSANRYAAERRQARPNGGAGRHPDARQASRSASQPWWKNAHRVMLIGALALVVVALPPLLIFGVWPRFHGASGNQINTLFPWAGSTQQTAPSADDAAFATQQDAVDPAFAAYYTAHAGATTLGTPLTPGFLTRSGIVQFYAFGALLTAAPTPGPTTGPTPTGTSVPAATATAAPRTAATAALTSAGDSALQLVGTGPTISGGVAGATPTATAGATPGATPSGAGSAIVALPVVAALLRAGSQTPVAPGGGTTYVDLRGAAAPNQLMGGAQASPLPTGAPTQPVFIATDTQGGKVQGHAIAPALWAYITRPDISPDGWARDIGAPLTEAQPLTVTQAGATHHLLIQAFWNAVLVADADTLASAQPSIARASIGRDYLLTLGPPTVAVSATTTAWALGAAAVLDAPVSGNATVHIGQNFPLTMTGESKWNQAALWYGVSWSAGAKSHGSGWLAGASLTFAAPDPSQPAHATFDTLSPDLASYLGQQGKNMGVAVYDVTRNTYYGYNDAQTIVLASTAKVYIMAAYLDWVEGQGRGLRSDEIDSLTAMIEHSDNNAAQLLYNRVGYDAGQRRFLQKIGITDYASCPDGWGCAQLSAADAAHILTLLQQGKILNDSDRQLALKLMNNIESDQQWGVGDTAPKGATYYMKDGWLDYPTPGIWNLNSVGIVTLGSETYVIGVYSQNNPSFDWSKVQHVCATVGQLLTS